jgi:hypothetical protein
VREDAEVSAENQANELRRRRGRASTILTDGETSSLGDGSVSAAAKLLGS